MAPSHYHDIFFEVNCILMFLSLKVHNCYSITQKCWFSLYTAFMFIVFLILGAALMSHLKVIYAIQYFCGSQVSYYSISLPNTCTCISTCKYVRVSVGTQRRPGKWKEWNFENLEPHDLIKYIKTNDQTNAIKYKSKSAYMYMYIYIVCM